MRKIWVVGLVVLGLTVGGHLGLRAQDQNEAKPKKLNPFTGNPTAIKEGRTIYFQYSCNGCHGGTGGGGMAGAPPLFDDEWNYGGDDKTLYMLLKGQIPNQIMPAIGKAMTDEEIWKTLAWIRSIYKGDPSRVNW